MKNNYNLLESALKSIRKNTDFQPEIAIVLGSGLEKFADNIDVVSIISYRDIDNFPISTNKMHKGRFIFGYIGHKKIVVMEGRIHYYEGYTMEQVVMPIRLIKMLGSTTIILTNAAGGLNPDFVPGNLMAITDHISTFVPSPLIGANYEELGTRFPDMTNVYSKELLSLLKKCAKELNIDLKEGVYCQITGPNYETPAEINLYRILGATAVGMSTACEAMAAIHCGLKVCGISCITNMAAGMSGKPLDDNEVGEIASTSSQTFANLLTNFINAI